MMLRKSLFLMLHFFLLAIVLLITPKNISAESYGSCENRYVTFVNPVRGRDLWMDSTTKPVIDQSKTLYKYGYFATWLLQYDALTDKDLTNVTGDFRRSDEKGVLLEVSRRLANKSGVHYPDNLRWSDPGAVFLSAYTRAERRKIIDTLYGQFRFVYGYYPTSVGAWWIDSYSLNYIKEKYGLTSVLIVADQKTTDSYGVWGQWWGLPYNASRYNIMSPSKSKEDSLGAVVIQWAQRDPDKAQGVGPLSSNFSLQANDYTRLGQDINFFKKLSDVYLSCDKELGQITIGLETGMESVGFAEEYEKQLGYLSTLDNLKPVTMEQFSKIYNSVYVNNPEKITIGSWLMTTDDRKNLNTGETIVYNSKSVFPDVFLPDKDGFLKRYLTSEKRETSTSKSSPWVFLSVVSCLILRTFKKKRVILPVLVVGAFSMHLLFKSFIVDGWQVFFGPLGPSLETLWVLSAIFVFSLVLATDEFVLKRLDNPLLFYILLPFSYSADFFVSLLRYSQLANEKIFGLLFNTYFFGLTVGESTVHLLVKKFDLETSLAFTALPIEKIQANPYIYIVVLPVIHLIITLLLYMFVKRVNVQKKRYIIFILAVMTFFYLYNMFNADPTHIAR